MSEPVKIVACTFSAGTGNGIAAMDRLLWEGLDRRRFALTYCFTPIAKGQSLPPDGFHREIPLRGRFRRLCDLFRGADIVQFNGVMDPVACDAAVAAGVPSVVEVIHQCERGQRFPDISVSVCVSEAVRDCQAHPERCGVISNGIDTERFSPPDKARAKNRFVILQVAQRSKAMHFHADDIADALLALDPGVEVWLAGAGMTGPDSHGGRVKYLGVCGNMPELYRQADVLLLASVRDAFGLACAEAMACGCVPVVSGDGGMRHIMTHESDGWLLQPEADGRILPDRAVDAVRAALALRDAGAFDSVRDAARHRAAGFFSREACVAGYEALYEGLVRKNGSWNGSGPADFVLSAESPLAQTAFLAQRGAGFEEIVAELIDFAGGPLRPLCDPEDPFWQTVLHSLSRMAETAEELGGPEIAAYIHSRIGQMLGRVMSNTAV